MAECLVPPTLQGVGPSLVRVTARFRVTEPVSHVALQWHTYTCVPDTDSPGSTATLSSGTREVELETTLPAPKVIDFSEVEPILFELKCDERVLWSEWYKPFVVDGNLQLVPTVSALKDSCQLARSGVWRMAG